MNTIQPAKDATPRPRAARPLSVDFPSRHALSSGSGGSASVPLDALEKIRKEQNVARKSQEKLRRFSLHKEVVLK